jgi:competence transcription factor ComK
MMKTRDGKTNMAITIMLKVSPHQAQRAKAMSLKVGQMRRMNSKRSMVPMPKPKRSSKTRKCILKL